MRADLIERLGQHPLSPRQMREFVLELARDASTRGQALEIADMMYQRAIDALLVLTELSWDDQRESELAFWQGVWSALLNVTSGDKIAREIRASRRRYAGVDRARRSGRGAATLRPGATP